MTFKTTFISICTILFFSQSAKAQNIGINADGATPNTSAMLDIDVSSLGTKKGILIPRMTAAEHAAMDPLPAAAQGLIIYQTDGIQGFYYNTSATTTPAWSLVFSSGTGGWSTTGNAGTSAGTHFMGTTDAIDWVVKTSNLERMRVLATGNVGIGIGTNPPSHQLTIEGSSQTLRLIGPGVFGSTSKMNFGDGNYVSLSEDIDDKLLIYADIRTAIMGGNVGIGTLTPDGSAKIDITSTDKGLLIPRVTLTGTSDASTIASPATSLVVYNTATAGVSPNNVLPGFYYWAGSKWISLSGGHGGKDWSLTGNAGSIAGTNFMGTTDAVDLVFKSNNSEFIRIDTTGMVGIGTNNPTEKLHVAGGNILIENDYFIKNAAGYHMIGTEGGLEAGIAIGDVNSNSHLKLIVPPGAANALLFVTPLASNYAYFTNTGNLGLGQVVPNERIRVNGNIQVDIPYHVKNSNGNNLVGTTLAGEIEIGDPSTWDGLTIYVPQDSGITFSTAVGTNSGFYDADGNLGIATTNPTERLHVKQGNIKIEQNYHLKNFDNYNLLGTDFGGNQELGDPTNPKALLLNTPSGAGNGIYFVNPVAYGVYTNTGKFGIGTGVIDPTERFQLAGGNMQIDNNFFIKGKHSTGIALNILGINNLNWINVGDGSLAYEGINLISSGAASGAVKVSCSTGGVIAYFSENGKVGIGTTSPLLKLDARGAYNKTGTAFENIFQVGSADVGNPIALRIGIKSDAVDSDRYASIEIDDEGTKRALVLQPTGGDVGIGTTSPTAKLEVAGQLKITGGTPGAGKVLTSDAAGLSTWETPVSSSGIQNNAVGNNFSTGQAASFDITGDAEISGALAVNGNVGIGIASPVKKLQVIGDVEVGNDVAWGSAIDDRIINFGDADYVYIGEKGGDDLMELRAAQFYFSTGNVGIGTTAPSEKLEVCGNLKVIGTINASSTINASQAISCSSDIRFKKNITPFTGALNKTLLLEGVNYYWKTSEFPQKGFTSDKQLGFIAQEVEKIVPEIVYTDSEGYKSIDYSRLTPVLIEAIKELNAKVESLEKQIAETNLKNKKLEDLNERIVLLEKIIINPVTVNNTKVK